ncbi:MAG: glycosyltransferase [Dehalococcoidia bacterium]|nr:glycosyltransferase [Dehalococcoidia bacterium]
MSNITCILFTYNEERRIKYALRNLQYLGDIIIIDNYSTDRTRDIAAGYTEYIYQFKNPGFVEHETAADFALSKVKTRWVYWAYVSDILPKSLLYKLSEISRQNSYKVVLIRRKSISYGEDTRNWGYSASSPRLFVKGSIDFHGNTIHRFGKIIVPKKEILRLPVADDLAIWQFRDYDTIKTELVHSGYVEIEARSDYEIFKKRFSSWRILVLPFKEFISSYLRHGAFRFGWTAFFNAVWRMMLRFNIEARIWELENKMTLRSVQALHASMKEELLKEFKKF